MKKILAELCNGEQQLPDKYGGSGQFFKSNKQGIVAKHHGVYDQRDGEVAFEKLSGNSYGEANSIT